MHVFHVTMIARFHSTYSKTTHKIDQSHECGLCLSIVNAVVIAVAVMLLLALLRVHVVIALFLGALAGGLMAGMGIEATMLAFQSGLGDGAKIALSYALLGAFAMAVAASGLPKVLADTLIRRLDADAEQASEKVVKVTAYLLIIGILAMSIMSQNLIPVHIAFIPLLIPPLLSVMNRLKLDRRLIACVLTFGLVTTYMTLPVGFGRWKIFAQQHRKCWTRYRRDQHYSGRGRSGHGYGPGPLFYLCKLP